MSLDDVAKVTKIQPRILERLEAGKLDGLPAEVFVRGFVRSFARCVGLEEAEALRRYAACGPQAALALGSTAPSEPVTVAVGTMDLTPTARALVAAMAELAPQSARSSQASDSADGAAAARETPQRMAAVAVDVIDLAAGSLQDLPSSSAGVPAIAESRVPPLDTLDAQLAAATSESTGEPAAAGSPAELPADASISAPASSTSSAPTSSSASGSTPVPASAGSAAPSDPVSSTEGKHESKSKKRRRKSRDRRSAAAARQVREILATGTPADAQPVVAAGWAPRALSTVPWRRPACAAATGALVPSLVIDDADPESAERVLEERAEKQAPRRSLLPPILLDREDRSARQGGLTLAVIILLIAATLTLSYLMRRPSASGDGMTSRALPASHVG